MPRAIAQVRRETTLRGLVNNLFAFDDATGAEDRRRAERAVLRDNPALAERANFRPGLSIVVPADIGLRTTERVQRPEVSVGGLLDDGSQRLVLAETAVKDGVALQRTANVEALGRLTDRQFLAAVGRVAPDAATRLEAVRSRIQQNDERATAIETQLSAALAAAGAELARLRELATPADPQDSPSPDSGDPLR